MFCGGAIPSQINSLESMQVESLSPRSTPWEAYRHALSFCAAYLFYNHIFIAITHTHTCSCQKHGWLCSYGPHIVMCNNHIVMMAHTPAFLQVGEHSGTASFPTYIRTAHPQPPPPHSGTQLPQIKVPVSCLPFYFIILFELQKSDRNPPTKHVYNLHYTFGKFWICLLVSVSA